MELGKATYQGFLSEEDLKEAIEDYILKTSNNPVKITHIEHLVGTRTEGHGYFEIDVPYQEGVKITCKSL